MKPQLRLKCYLYDNLFFSIRYQSCVSQFKQSKLYFPMYETPFSSMSTFACVIWCSRPPNSERDVIDTQSRYANLKSYITLNCRRAFQIWHITDMDNKESFTSVEIIPLPVLRYFMLRPMVPDDRYRILVNAYFQAWSISRLTAVIHQVSSTD